MLRRLFLKEMGIQHTNTSKSQGFAFQSYSQGRSKDVCVKFTITRTKSTIWQIGYLLLFPLVFTLARSSVFYTCESGITFPNCVSQSISTLLSTIFYILIFLLITLKFLFTIRKESLLITVPIGIQFSSVYAYGKKNVTFIPWCAVEDIIITEVISGQQVLFYLSLLLNDNYKNDVNSLLILFQNTRPRLTVLEEMYNVIQQIFSSNVQ